MLKRLFVITAASLLGMLVFAEAAFAFESVRFAIREICGHMMGNLGGLLMVVAGIGGLASAAFGNFRASQSLIITAIGAFAISSILSLYFPTAAAECVAPGAGGGNGARTAQTAQAQAQATTLTRENFFPQDDGFTRNADAALAIASGREADFENSAPIEQAADAEDFDGGFNDFGEEF